MTLAIQVSTKTETPGDSYDESKLFNSSCPSKSGQEENNNEVCKYTKAESSISRLRNTTASVADALLKLGGSQDDVEPTLSNPLKRKRSLFVLGERKFTTYVKDAASTVSETDTESTDHFSKRFRNDGCEQRRAPSDFKLNLPLSLSIPRTNGTGNEVDDALTFSTSEFQLPLQDFNERKCPGELGPISSTLQDFRPLRARPHMPTFIVPEHPPPPQQNYYSPQLLPSDSPMMTSVVAADEGCFVLHSYTIVPRQNLHPTPLPLMTNAPYPCYR
ncbi:unnamed protein product [Pseudo-nitzschia multistriata]|uniref:Uncharacterized protein n=1 Tax=Pseudo-nitzschia multistriata TaxID=183589 RepID=A0A448ZM71_9STRA|nr:unnamed protein product [Pseudo-nitzschia multistriata]